MYHLMLALQTNVHVHVHVHVYVDTCLQSVPQVLSLSQTWPHSVIHDQPVYLRTHKL